MVENPAGYSDVRTEYTASALARSDLATEPMAQVRAWLDEALSAGVVEPNAVVLSTIRSDGSPDARVLLLRGLDHGLVIFTNYQSAKGAQLEADSRAHCLFFWPTMQRQIRLSGRVERVSAAESDAYFASRPRGSQLGAWASPQSTVVADRDEIEALNAEVEARFLDAPVPRPPHWGGFRVVPETFEFWQGRPSRLHDRFRYRPDGGGGYVIERLAP